MIYKGFISCQANKLLPKLVAKDFVKVFNLMDHKSLFITGEHYIFSYHD